MTQGRVAGGLSLGLGHLLHRRASGDDPAPRLCQRHQHPLADARAVLVLERGGDRELASRCNGASSASNTARTAAPTCRSSRRSRSTRATPPRSSRKAWRSPSAGASEEHRAQDRGRPNAKLYMDEALTPVAEEDSEHMELYTQNEAARAAVERERRVAGQARQRARGACRERQRARRQRACTITTITPTSTKSPAPRPRLRPESIGNLPAPRRG